MKDKGKTKEQLISKLEELRQRVLELEKSEAERKRAEQEAQEARSYAESIIETVREPLLFSMPSCEWRLQIEHFTKYSRSR